MVGATGTIPFINTNLDTSLDSPVDYTYNTRPSDSAAWTAEIDGDNTSVFGYSLPTAKIIKSSNTMTDPLGDILKVTYKAHISKTTIAGTYTGHATYILAPNVPEGDRAALTNCNPSTDMQCWNGYNTLDEGDVIALTDLRDNKRYNVSKLADGNVWMVQNLALEPGEEISYLDSNLPVNAAYTIPDGFTGWGSDAENAVFGNHTNADSNSYGSYYSFLAATAGIIDETIFTGDSLYDICPKGWRLPSKVSAENLLDSYGYTVSEAVVPAGWNAAWHPAFAGMYTGSISEGVGFWWTNNFLQGSSASILAQSDSGESSTLGISGGGSRPIGLSVRCVFDRTGVIYSTYGVLYDANGGFGAPTVSESSSELITLSEERPLRSGYEFRGWSTSKDGASGVFKPGQVVNLNADEKKVVLYAVWKKKATTVLGYMQDNNTIQTCKSMLEGESAIAIDSRDNKQYYIAKLNDGNCWMQQNLDLDLAVINDIMYAKSASGTTTKLDNKNTNITTNQWYIPNGSQGYDTQKASEEYKWNFYSCANENKDAIWESTSGDPHYNMTQTWCGSEESPLYEVRSYDPGNTCELNINDDDAVGNNCKKPVGSAEYYKNGNLYNWPAATAGTGSYIKTSVVTSSICPKGWRLPMGTSTGEYNNLLKNINTTDVPKDQYFYNTPYYLTRAGLFKVGGYINNRGTQGEYWTSTPTSGQAQVYVMTFNQSIVYTGINSGGIKGEGYSIRCVAN